MKHTVVSASQLVFNLASTGKIGRQILSDVHLLYLQ
jgi:hypothetical protein